MKIEFLGEENKVIYRWSNHMKSIGFIILNKDDKIEGELSYGSEDELRQFVSMVNAAPNTFNMTSYCPLRVVEAFVNDE